MQCFTIARAVLINPANLILDEATSSVDTRLELYIQEAMKRLIDISVISTLGIFIRDGSSMFKALLCI